MYFDNPSSNLLASGFYEIYLHRLVVSILLGHYLWEDIKTRTTTYYLSGCHRIATSRNRHPLSQEPDTSTLIFCLGDICNSLFPTVGSSDVFAVSCLLFPAPVDEGRSTEHQPATGSSCCRGCPRNVLRFFVWMQKRSMQEYLDRTLALRL